MAESYLERVANELAEMALADQNASGDIAIVDQISEVLGASSQVLQESYMTAIRVRRAEARARKLLADRMATSYAEQPKPKPAPLQGLPETEEAVEPEIEEMPAAETVAEDAQSLRVVKAAPQVATIVEEPPEAPEPIAAESVAAEDTPPDDDPQDEEDDALMEMWGETAKAKPVPPPAMPRRVKR